MFLEIHARLGILIYTFYEQLNKRGITDMTITSIIRPHTDDSGVHELGRGCDIRIDFPRDICDEIVSYINKNYIYDYFRPQFKSALVHETDVAGDAGVHIHLQTL